MNIHQCDRIDQNCFRENVHMNYVGVAGLFPRFLGLPPVQMFFYPDIITFWQ